MLIEAAALGLFMVSACAFGALLESPASPVHRVIVDPFVRRACMGLAMGLTAIGLIYSPWGKRSGAHMNPAVTLAFWRLGRVAGRDAFAYACAQCAGAVVAVFAMARLIGPPLTGPPVAYVQTLPGSAGVAWAFMAELAISMLLMLAVLSASARARVAPATGIIAGTLVALWITFEAPISGMSMNPARTLGSAVVAGRWEHLWLYWVAPPMGMLVAAELHRWFSRSVRVDSGALECAKLHHAAGVPCIFCEFRARTAAGSQRDRVARLATF